MFDHINYLQVGDIVAFDNTHHKKNKILGQRLITAVGAKKAINGDDWLNENNSSSLIYSRGRPTSLFTVETHLLAKDKKSLIAGSRLSFDTTDDLALRVRKVGHLNIMPDIPADK